jgi:hypothetical protein
LKLIPVGVEPSFALHGLARLRQDTQGYAGIRGTTQPAVDTKNAESRPVARSACSRAFQRSVLLCRFNGAALVSRTSTERARSIGRSRSPRSAALRASRLGC